MSSKFGPIRPWTAEIAALERLKKIPIVVQWEKCCEHPSTFIFDLQETKKCIKAWMRSNFNKIRPLTTELTALEHLKYQCIML